MGDDTTRLGGRDRSNFLCYTVTLSEKHSCSLRSMPSVPPTSPTAAPSTAML